MCVYCLSGYFVSIVGGYFVRMSRLGKRFLEWVLRGGESGGCIGRVGGSF